MQHGEKRGWDHTIRCRTILIVRSLAFGLLLAGGAGAEAGTHAPVISTWDTRSSSLSLDFRPGFVSGGHFDVASYYANFQLVATAT